MYIFFYLNKTDINKSKDITGRLYRRTYNK